MRATRISVGLFTVLIAFASTIDAAVNVTLENAIRQGKVRVEVKSLGGATGNGVRVDVRSLVGEELHVEVEAGTAIPGEVLLSGERGELQLLGWEDRRTGEKRRLLASNGATETAKEAGIFALNARQTLLASTSAQT